LSGETIPHAVLGRADGGKVLLRPASQGTGVIAGGGVRAVLEAAGIKNILSKSLGSSNKLAVVNATVDGLNQLRTASMINAIRNPDSSPEPIPSEKTEVGGDETNPPEDQAPTQEPIPEQENPSDEA
ncbi:MAG: hypothetical protein AAEJ57_02210, partial [Opitutales bacterium]